MTLEEMAAIIRDNTKARHEVDSVGREYTFTDGIDAAADAILTAQAAERGVDAGVVEASTVTIPWPPTREMMQCLYVDQWPQDWERGKRLQREWGDDCALGAGDDKGESPRIVPFATECEVTAGQLDRFVEVGRALLSAQGGRADV